MCLSCANMYLSISGQQPQNNLYIYLCYAMLGAHVVILTVLQRNTKQNCRKIYATTEMRITLGYIQSDFNEYKIILIQPNYNKLIYYETKLAIVVPTCDCKIRLSVI